MKKYRNLPILIIIGLIGKQDKLTIIGRQRYWTKLIRKNNDEYYNKNKNKTYLVFYKTQIQIVTIVIKEKKMIKEP